MTERVKEVSIQICPSSLARDYPANWTSSLATKTVLWPNTNTNTNKNTHQNMKYEYKYKYSSPAIQYHRLSSLATKSIFRIINFIIDNRLNAIRQKLYEINGTPKYSNSIVQSCLHLHSSWAVGVITINTNQEQNASRMLLKCKLSLRVH